MINDRSCDKFCKSCDASVTDNLNLMAILSTDVMRPKLSDWVMLPILSSDIM